MTTPDPVTNLVLPQEPKAGYATTEFWATAVTAVVGVLVGLGLIGPDFAKHHESLVNALALLGSLVAPGLYALSRGLVKKAHVAAVGAVQAQSIASTGAPLPVTSAGKVVNPKLPKDAGCADLAGLIAGVLVLAGLIWLVVGFTRHHLDVFGLVLLLVGAGVYLLLGRTPRARL